MADWKAKWVSYIYDPKQDLGVFAFRNVLNLGSAPASLPIRISADNRYKLYVNGAMVAFGPQRGDEHHWFYDHFDLAPQLREGENVIVALVWNFGWLAPMAQHTVRTAFVFESPIDSLRTPGAWEAAKIAEWEFEMMHSSIGEFYIDIGPGEIIKPHLLPSEGLPTDWKKPNVICHAEERGANGGGTPWMLIPRTLPAMRYDVRATKPVVRHGFLGDAPGTTLYDYGELLCAYPRLVVSGPSGAVVTLTYAEALWQTDGNKGNRDEVEGKEMRGYQDKLVLGPEPSTYEPLWWRTYRYLMIEVEDGVTVQSVDAIETGYPLKAESSFEADDPVVKPIWDVSVRTAERCAGETYFDCPYYEQLQYAGDTRIQALIGYYLGRDRELQRNAVETLGWSMMENGLTHSRYPSRQTQVIPPFSLWWVLMTYDQMLYDTHRSFGMQAASMSSSVIEGAQYALIDKKFWNFADWVPEWRWGVPPGCGYSMNTFLAETARIAKMKKLSRAIFSVADEIALQMDEEEGDDHLDVFREGLDDDVEFVDGLVRHVADDEWSPSEHTEALFRQYQMILDMEPSPWPYAALERANAAKCTYYFSYYKHLAMQPEDYIAQLGPWKEMIESGLSTFAENPEPTRSDCHAWSAHPILGFFQLIAGVTSVAPAWKKARIAPKPGSLKRFDARIAHPDGELRVAYEDGKISIESPVPFEFVWKGRKEGLKAGRHSF
jgi:alpha-L-rhamnosidase